MSAQMNSHLPREARSANIWPHSRLIWRDLFLETQYFSTLDALQRNVLHLKEKNDGSYLDEALNNGFKPNVKVL